MGKYLNGERNGKGKEYINGGLVFRHLSDSKNRNKNNHRVLIFEGEFFNWLKHGYGKEYYFEGGLKFEGQFLYGERNGKGKEYDEFGNVKFEGEYLNGNRIGNERQYKLGILNLKSKYNIWNRI